MEADELVAEHVAAGSNSRRDLDSPLIAVGDKLVRRPFAGRAGPIDQPLLRNLEKAEVARLCARAAARALGQVVDHRAMVGIWPGVPAQSDGRPGGHRDLGRAGRGGLVAGDVAGAEGVGRNEAVILVEGKPAGALGFAALLVKPAL